ncbi:hypothetical protein pEp_SNUABM04_00041 [Erwinia phage pEp_SNUABM_04]|nr:hypothetical protein pEp_SNUABM04_00041 [Erwinia phage pEp_SNUABM_04]
MAEIKKGDFVLRCGGNASTWASCCREVGHSPTAVFRVEHAAGYHVRLKGLEGSWVADNFRVVPDPNQTISGGQASHEVIVKPATYTGGSSDYYQVQITSTTTKGRPAYIAECNDIIEALGMNFAEGNAFKALWRRAAQRTLGLTKAGAKADGLYDAEKVEFFGARLVEQSKNARS